MSHDAIALFTRKSVETILDDGGTQSWVLDRANARHCRYVVLCRNTHSERSEGDEPHGAGFMIGRIADVVPSTENPERWKILFSEYSVVSMPSLWGGWRNPVRYTTMEDLGIDPNSLDFRPMPENGPGEGDQARGSTAAPRRAGPLSFAEARKALAVTFGVSPEAIEITIRG